MNSQAFWAIVEAILSQDSIQEQVAGPVAVYLSTQLDATEDTIVANFLEKVVAHLRKTPVS